MLIGPNNFGFNVTVNKTINSQSSGYRDVYSDGNVNTLLAGYFDPVIDASGDNRQATFHLELTDSDSDGWGNGDALQDQLLPKIRAYTNVSEATGLPPKLWVSADQGNIGTYILRVNNDTELHLRWQTDSFAQTNESQYAGKLYSGGAELFSFTSSDAGSYNNDQWIYGGMPSSRLDGSVGTMPILGSAPSTGTTMIGLFDPATTGLALPTWTNLLSGGYSGVISSRYGQGHNLYATNGALQAAGANLNKNIYGYEGNRWTFDGTNDYIGGTLGGGYGSSSLNFQIDKSQDWTTSIWVYLDEAVANRVEQNQSNSWIPVMNLTAASNPGSIWMDVGIYSRNWTGLGTNSVPGTGAANFMAVRTSDMFSHNGQGSVVGTRPMTEPGWYMLTASVKISSINDTKPGYLSMYVNKQLDKPRFEMDHAYLDTLQSNNDYNPHEIFNYIYSNNGVSLYSQVEIGRDHADAGNYMPSNMNIGHFLAYKGRLSHSDIRRNYEVLKERYSTTYPPDGRANPNPLDR